MTQPRIVGLPARPYVAIPGTVTMQTIGMIADRLPEVFGWLAGRGIAPAGAPFLRYNVIDMDAELQLEAGVPIAVAVPGEGDIRSGILPAGRFVTLTHVGHFDELHEATAALLRWAGERGLTWDQSGQRWGCRLEIYHTNPAEQPDPTKWETELQFRLADQSQG
jgi:effector-binding domain-containing protein